MGKSALARESQQTARHKSPKWDSGRTVVPVAILICNLRGGGWRTDEGQGTTKIKFTQMRLFSTAVIKVADRNNISSAKQRKKVTCHHSKIFFHRLYKLLLHLF